MAQKQVWTGRVTVGTRLQHDHQVANLCPTQVHLFGKNIERGAQRADNTDGFTRFGRHPVRGQHGIILSDYLAEVAGCRQVMM